MEYMGVKSTAQGREYAFRVRFSPQDSRDYTVTTANEIFTSHHMSYLDGPNVSSSQMGRLAWAKTILENRRTILKLIRQGIGAELYATGHFVAVQPNTQQQR